MIARIRVYDVSSEIKLVIIEVGKGQRTYLHLCALENDYGEKCYIFVQSSQFNKVWHQGT